MTSKPKSPSETTWTTGDPGYLCDFFVLLLHGGAQVDVRGRDGGPWEGSLGSEGLRAGGSKQVCGAEGSVTVQWSPLVANRPRLSPLTNSQWMQVKKGSRGDGLLKVT